MKKTNLIIFDVDGVLEREDRMVKLREVAIKKELAKRHKLSLQQIDQKILETKNSMHEKRKHTSSYVFEKMGLKRGDYFKLLDRVKPRGIKPSPHCKRMLSEMGKRSDIVVYSNSSHKSTINTLRKLKIAESIKRIYSSEMFTESKPSLNNLRIIMRERGFKPKNAFFVGNSLQKDIIPPHKLGMTAILFSPNGKFTKKNAKEADYIIKDLGQIPRIIKKKIG